ncbi:MAG: hypothetical protein KDB74_01535 [Flavobacteriales bacterium]|nr:hypothetical protein [Flavobacteriales bacterium]
MKKKDVSVKESVEVKPEQKSKVVIKAVSMITPAKVGRICVSFYDSRLYKIEIKEPFIMISELKDPSIRSLIPLSNVTYLLLE